MIGYSLYKTHICAAMSGKEDGATCLLRVRRSEPYSISDVTIHYVSAEC